MRKLPGNLVFTDKVNDTEMEINFIDCLKTVPNMDILLINEV